MTDQHATRPYPNVRPSRSNTGRWEARHPINGKQTYLGTFDTAEEARHAVLIAQAEHLEAKAHRYRIEAELVRDHHTYLDTHALWVHCKCCDAKPGTRCSWPDGMPRATPCDVRVETAMCQDCREAGRKWLEWQERQLTKANQR